MAFQSAARLLTAAGVAVIVAIIPGGVGMSTGYRVATEEFMKNELPINHPDESGSLNARPELRTLWMPPTSRCRRSCHVLKSLSEPP